MEGADGVEKLKLFWFVVNVGVYGAGIIAYIRGIGWLFMFWVVFFNSWV